MFLALGFPCSATAENLRISVAFLERQFGLGALDNLDQLLLFQVQVSNKAEDTSSSVIAKRKMLCFAEGKLQLCHKNRDWFRILEIKLPGLV